MNEVFIINGEPVLVEDIPARVCDPCPEISFSRQATESVRSLVHGDVEPSRAAQVKVFEFARVGPVSAVDRRFVAAINPANIPPDIHL